MTDGGTRYRRRTREERLARQIARGLWHDDPKLYQKLSNRTRPPFRFTWILMHPPLVVIWILAVLAVVAATFGCLWLAITFLHHLTIPYPYNLG